MKRINTLLIAITLIAVFTSSCEEDEKDPLPAYQVINNTEEFTDNEGIEELDGTLYDATVYYFKENGDMIGNEELGDLPPDGGTSQKVEVTDKKDAEKVKVGFRHLPSYNSYEIENPVYYTESFYYLEKGETKEIEINGNTMVGTQMEKSQQKNRRLLKDVIQELEN
jgi:hypothetical protein